MAIKYINHLRDNKNFSAPDASNFAKSLSFGNQLLDNKLTSFSSINLNQLKEDESEQSNASFQNSMHNSFQSSMNKPFSESASDDYVNGFRDCYTEAIRYLTTTAIQQQLQPTKDRFNEQLIVDLQTYLDAILSKNQQDLNSLANKRKIVDFSPKSSISVQSVDGLQIKLEEMDVEESSTRAKKQDKFNSSNSFDAQSGNAINLSTTTGKCQPASMNNTLKNYLTNNDLLRADYIKSSCFANLDLDLNPAIKSRSLTSSPNSSNLDYPAYKFKSSIREKFDAESKTCKSRPRSATYAGANASSIRRLNVPLEHKEKLVNSTAELNARENGRAIVEHRLLENRSIDQQLDGGRPDGNQLPKSSNSTKRASPGFVLHPNQSYYIPIQIDLANLMTHLTKPNATNPLVSQEDLLINLPSLSGLQSAHASATSPQQPQQSQRTTVGQKINQQLNLHYLNHLNSLQNSSQTSLNQSFQDHLSYSSPSLNSLNSINNSSLSNYLQNSSIKCCLDDKLTDDTLLYPISISVNFKFPPLSLNAILNSQKSS